MPKQIVAIAPVTDVELASLGPAFSRAYPVDQAPCFGGLLAAIDDADRELWRERDRAEGPLSVVQPVLKKLRRSLERGNDEHATAHSYLCGQPVLRGMREPKDLHVHQLVAAEHPSRRG